MYDKLLESYFLQKLKAIHEGQVRSGNWSVLAWAIYGGDIPRERSSLDGDESLLYDELLETFPGSEDIFLDHLKVIHEAQVMGGNWSVLAWALYGGDTDTPGERDTLPTDDLKALYDKIRQSFAGNDEAFIAKLKYIYDAQVRVVHSVEIGVYWHGHYMVYHLRGHEILSQLMS